MMSHPRTSLRLKGRVPPQVRGWLRLTCVSSPEGPGGSLKTLRDLKVLPVELGSEQPGRSKKVVKLEFILRDGASQSSARSTVLLKLLHLNLLRTQVLQ